MNLQATDSMKNNPDSSSLSSKKRLKIAILIRGFVTTGGAEKYAVELTRRLAREHDVHVFAQEWSFNGKEKITFHKIPKFFTKPSYLNQLVFSFFTRRLVDSSFDIVHSHERVTSFDVLTVHCPCFRSSITGEKSAWKRGLLRLSITLSPRKSAYLWLEKRQFSFHKDRLLIAVSENVMRDVQANYPLPDRYLGIAYPGVDLNLTEKIRDENTCRSVRSRLGIKEQDFVVLFVGTEFKRKGLDALIRGFAAIPPFGTKLVIAGGGEKGNYARLAKSLKVEDHVIFLGLVENIEEIYEIADAYILPTLSDPAGMAPLEAMAFGVATIMSCSHYAGIAEHIRNGEALILQNPGDPGEIADSLRKVMKKDVRSKLIRKGRDLVRNLTWDKTTADTLDVYYKVLALRKAHNKN